MTFLAIANFKSNKTAEEVTTCLKAVTPTPNMVVAPSFPHLSLCHCVTAAQDVSPFPPGSYTGAVSAKVLKELGVSYCIVGHSERRRYFHETATDVAAKVRELVEVDITHSFAWNREQITSQFAVLDADLYDKCYFCFEPSGDIGGTVAAGDEEILIAKNKSNISSKMLALSMVARSIEITPLSYSSSGSADF